jgi:hypothetical protein
MEREGTIERKGSRKLRANGPRTLKDWYVLSARRSISGKYVMG